MNVTDGIMNKKTKAIAGAMAVLALVMGVFAFGSAIAVADTSTSEYAYESNSSYTECSLTVDKTHVDYEGEVTLSWDTEGFDTIKIDGQEVSGDSGSRTITLTTDTQFNLEATSDSGSSCTKTVTVTCDEPPKYCELEVNKAVDKSTANPGDELTYTIEVENTGDANCTGGGVKIFDHLDDDLTYLSHSLSGDVSAGYEGKPVYDSGNHTLHFNGNTLTPGESVTIDFTTEVKTPDQCGDFVVKNKAKATAKELNNYNNWSFSNKVTTDIDYDCDEPELPSCPFSAKDGRTIIDFAERIRSDQGANRSETSVVSANLAAGTYDVSLASWDGYIGRENVSQPNEKWKLAFVANGSVVNDSNVIGDLADNVRVATVDEKVNTGLVLSSAVSGVKAVHAVYPDTSSPNSLNPICAALDKEPEVPAPSCDFFEANPTSVVAGASTTLSWGSTNATEAFINNGVGEVDPDGSYNVSPLSNTTYTLTLIGAEDKTIDCEVPVTVSEDPVPYCESFTATPSNLPDGGGNVILDWEVVDATDASIAPTVGAVDLVGSTSVNVTDSTTFTLTATDDNDDEVMCEAPVVVDDPEPDPFTCENNVDFSASRTSIDRGDSLTLNWSTTDVDSVSISQINATSLSGSQSVSPSNDITYVLTATKDNDSIDCPVSVDVSSGGGGGGGSSSPRCELEISDSTIERGEEVTITWDTSRATEVVLTDDTGEELFTTADYLASDKEDYFDGSITLEPTRDTEYFLVAERGSRDDECEVEVEVEDGTVVLENRDQEPLVAGISLNQVPYTGFEAGPIMTFLFYLILIAWAVYVAYFIAVRNRTALESGVSEEEDSTPNMEAMKRAEAVRPDAFVASVSTTPTNLPTGTPEAGYEPDHSQVNVDLSAVVDEDVTALENRAHSQNALLSSDAIRQFMSSTEGKAERNETLDQVIAEAKKAYPLEDGWMVINEPRMRDLCQVCIANTENTETKQEEASDMPKGAGSLAEAIVAGNVVAAYDMVGKRPMLALADAAADLDALYRKRIGHDVTVSDLLETEAKDLSEEQIQNMIAALTGALDGTYTDEASAVKMAIMKAVRIAG